jgi:fumarate hydratase, class I
MFLCLLLVIFTSCGPQILGKITEEGVFLEQLETNPSQYLPEVEDKHLGGEVVKVSE